MKLTQNSLATLQHHWAVSAFNAEEIARVDEVVNGILVNAVLGQHIKFSFEISEADNTLIEKLSLAYELAAIEGFREFLHPASENTEMREQFIAASFKAFEINRIFPIPKESLDKVFFVLHLSALGYCGDRWADLRRWYKENPSLFEIEHTGSSWIDILLIRIYNCWIRLFRKKSWEDLEEISRIIIGLREIQETHENELLEKSENKINNAVHLLALYHWAKATELLAMYMQQGEPADIAAKLDKHFEAAYNAAATNGDAKFDVLLRWLHAASRQMVTGSLWKSLRNITPQTNSFLTHITKQGLFELLPPQRAAILEKGLLDQAATAIVVDMPTSGGKTLLAEFKILQALNQFDVNQGWVAYVSPTKALTSQICRRLTKDFAPIGINVVQLTGAVEIDAFEEDILSEESSDVFHILVCTPEKLQLVLRNKKIKRPLALIVMDEAHNIEDPSRGLRVELLLATIKREFTTSKFLLLMPYVPNADALARWLANDISAGRSISLSSSPWKPNDRIVGIYYPEQDTTNTKHWHLKFKTLVTSPKTIHLDGVHTIGGVNPFNETWSKIKSHATKQTAAVSKIFSYRGTSIAILGTIPHAWALARTLNNEYPEMPVVSDKIKLVQRFLQTEVSEDFELIEMLNKGIGVHHSGLSDEVRALIEWLAEENELKTLCATTTVTQGLNFPVSSIFLASRFVYNQSKHSNEPMRSRDFWNLAGRAGRMDQDSIGVVGIAMGDTTKEQEIVDFVARSTDDLVSRLVSLLNEIEEKGQLNNLEAIIHKEQWDDFRCYVAHLCNEKADLAAMLADIEQLLRNTYGYETLKASTTGRVKADKLLDVTKRYVGQISKNPGGALLADLTGFSPEGIGKALNELSQLENKLKPTDWLPDSLFGNKDGMANLIGVMLKIPQLNALNSISREGNNKEQIAQLTQAWVQGQTIKEIAKKFFNSTDTTDSITDACKIIYRNLVNNGTWGIAALSKLSGIDFELLKPEELRQINLLPAMIYHGVNTEEGILMRMNSVPRSIAVNLGLQLKDSVGTEALSIKSAKKFLRDIDTQVWDNAKPTNSSMSGKDYADVWGILSGETTQ